MRRGRVTVVAPVHAEIDTAISKDQEAVEKSDEGADNVRWVEEDARENEIMGCECVVEKTVSRWVRTKLIKLVDVATTALRPRAFAWREITNCASPKVKGTRGDALAVQKSTASCALLA